MKEVGKRKIILPENDKHNAIMLKLVDKIKKRYPMCGIGVSGSVAKGTHKSESDLDLLIVDTSFKRNRQFVFFFDKEISVNVICLNPEKLELKINDWALYFDGQHITYINITRILYDDFDLLKTLQRTVREKIQEIRNSNKEVLLKCFELLEKYSLKVYSSAKNINKRESSIMVLYMLINIWFIKKGIKNMTKKEDQNSFNTIKNTEKYIYDLIKNILLKNYCNEVAFQKLYAKIMS